jgi:ubiquinone/menaquinone biosynthesis C-methylase UbiE
MDEHFFAYYGKGEEGKRLSAGTSRIELARTQELLRRFLPPPPADVLDVGGGAGPYAAWLAGLGYRVHLVDIVPLHVEQAAAVGSFTASVGDARSLDQRDESQDAVLLLGPLYHLTERTDRLRALAEARRVLRPGGALAAAAISRFASVLDGVLNDFLGDPEFDAIVERDLRDGQHRNPNERAGYFTTAFFHHPNDLADEVREAGFGLEGVFGIEGPGWLLRDRWDDERGRAAILRAARALEREPTAVGVSAHLLAIARRDG